MNLLTISQLNELNKHFYKAVAEDFSDSRRYSWQGWHEIIPHLQPQIDAGRLSVLDIGCGNGRFAEFLVHQLAGVSIQYTGWDNNATLLEIAEDLIPLPPSKQTLKKLDLVETLIKEKPLLDIAEHPADLVTLFGVLHHIPSYGLRKKLFQELAKLLNPNGILVFSNWEFTEDPRFDSRRVKPSTVNVDSAQLEKNDFILDWQKGTVAHRYCHHCDQEELAKLITASGLTQLAQFRADGKSGKLNSYLILKKA